MASQLPTIAFFGATGGCTSTALALTLKAGHKATALARTPKKLHDLLLTLEVPESVIASNLTIVEGPAQDLAAVKATLAPANQPVSKILFGIGGTPKLTANPLRPVTLDNPHICEEGTTSVLTALREFSSAGIVTPENKPTMVIISTTGISKRDNDVPLAMYPIFHYMLSVPHKDKRVMEDLVIDAAKTGLIHDFVIVRPTLLVDGRLKGLDCLRVGWELPGTEESGDKKDKKDKKGVKASKQKSDKAGPAVGYGISRLDVGNWIFEKALKVESEYLGKCVSLTY